MSAEFLDLDAIVPPRKEVGLFGTRYPLEELGVKDLIEITREAKRLEKDMRAGKSDDADVLESYLGTVKRYLPSISSEHLSKVTLPQVAAIIAFAQAVAESGAPEASAEKKAESSAS